MVRLDCPDTVTGLVQSRGRLRSFKNKFYAIVKYKENKIYDKLKKQEKFVKFSVLLMQTHTYPPREIYELEFYENKNCKTKVEEYKKKLESCKFDFDLKYHTTSKGNGFESIIYINTIEVASGFGSNKKEAKEKASYNLLYNDKKLFVEILTQIN